MGNWELPNDWEWIPLSQLCEIYGGSTPRTANPGYFGGDIVWVTPTDIDMSNGIQKITNSKTKITQEGLNSISAQELPIGTVLFSSRASIGKIAIAGVKLITNQGFANFVCNTRIDNLYLAWCLKLFTEEIKKLATSTTYLEVSKSKLRTFQVPIPYPSDFKKSIEVQRRIVVRIEALLSEVREMRNLNEKIKADAEGLLSSVYRITFPDPHKPNPENWGLVPLSAITEDGGRRNPSQRPDDYFRYVDIGSVENKKGEIIDELVKRILGADAPSRARKIIRSGDVIVATTRPYLRSIARVPATLDDGICSTGFSVLRPIEGFGVTGYIYHYCRSDYFINQLIPKQRGANYPAVSDEDVRICSIPIPYPENAEKSYSEQQKLAYYLQSIADEVTEMKDLQKTDKLLCDQLEQTILAQAYRGEF